MAMGSRNSEAGLPAWVRWFFPSVADLLFVALLVLLACTALSVRLLGDAGIGWHIRTGQLILATHAIPRVDPFSSSMSGQSWFAWEWLYDVLVGWLEKAAGLNGVVLLTALVIAGVFSWTLRLLVRSGTNVLLALPLVLLAASAAMIHFLARPHVVSWLFTVAWFWALEWSEEMSALLWLLPLSMLLWVNLHGGFLIGFVLLAIYWVDAACRSLRPKGDRFEDVLQKIRAGRHVRALTLFGIASAAATLVNPYGFKLHVHIYRYLSNRFLMDHIDEFQSPNFHFVAQKCFAGLLLLTLAALVTRRRESGKVSVSQGLVLLFAVYSGLWASRNIPVASLLLILVIGPWLSDAMGSLTESRSIAVRARSVAAAGFARRMDTMELGLGGHLWPIAAVVLLCWTAAHGGKLGAVQVMDAHFNPKRFPVAAVDYLEKQNVQGPVVSPDYWGGYLIYRLYPRVQVVVDDRHDFYGEEFLKSYLKMIHVESGWQDFLQRHPGNCLVVPRNSALANILGETRGWRAFYSDDVAVVFMRALSERN
jgi:hypothetical protein